MDHDPRTTEATTVQDGNEAVQTITVYGHGGETERVESGRYPVLELSVEGDAPADYGRVMDLPELQRMQQPDKKPHLKGRATP